MKTVSLSRYYNLNEQKVTAKKARTTDYFPKPPKKLTVVDPQDLAIVNSPTNTIQKSPKPNKAKVNSLAPPKKQKAEQPSNTTLLLP